ncbi:hypothetical protein P7C73_g1246, partial [Tremellales sp. Uapishka_1]
MSRMPQGAPPPSPPQSPSLPSTKKLEESSSTRPETYGLFDDMSPAHKRHLARWEKYHDEQPRTPVETQKFAATLPRGFMEEMLKRSLVFSAIETDKKEAAKSIDPVVGDPESPNTNSQQPTSPHENPDGRSLSAPSDLAVDKDVIIVHNDASPIKVKDTGPNACPLQTPLCAFDHCRGRQPRFTCSSCRLVLYCNAACQRAHHSEHKKVCSNPLLKADWAPDSIRSGILPDIPIWTSKSPFVDFVAKQVDPEGELGDWIDPGAPDHQVCLCGIPFCMRGCKGDYPFYLEPHQRSALNLAYNEGLFYDKPLSLLFVEQACLKTLMYTVAELPALVEKNEKHTVVWSEMTGSYVPKAAVILTLLARAKEDQVENAAQVALHVQYSGILPSWTRPFLLDALDSLLGWRQTHTFMVKRAVGMQRGLGGDEKGTRFGDSEVAGRLYVQMEEHDWRMLETWQENLLSPVEVRKARLRDAWAAIDKRQGEQQLNTHTLDMLFTALKPGHRMCHRHFRRHPVLLPFGNSNLDDTALVNDLLFDAQGKWTIRVEDSPFQSFLPSDYLLAGKRARCPELDIIGGLFFHVKSVNLSAAQVLRNHGCNVLITNGSIETISKLEKLPFLLPATFDRILTGSAADIYHGPDVAQIRPIVGSIVKEVADLLNRKNKFATATLTYKKWIQWDVATRTANGVITLNPRETLTFLEHFPQLEPLPVIAKRFKKPSALVGIENQAIQLVLMKTLDCVMDNEDEFESFLQEIRLERCLALTQLERKFENTVFPEDLQSTEEVVTFESLEDVYTKINLASECNWATRTVEIQASGKAVEGDDEEEMGMEEQDGDIPAEDVD